MFPRFFPYGQLPSVPNVNAFLSLNLGLPLDSSSLVPAQDLSSLLLPSQSNFSVSSAVQAPPPYFLPQGTGFWGGIPINNTTNPLMAQLNLPQMLSLLNPGLLQQPTWDTMFTPSEPSEAHTIVRAPVLYGNNRDSTVSETSSKEEIKSPPGQIVASYAAAARAAAIAYQQPLSNAAEAFLSAAGSLAGNSGQAVTMAKNRTASGPTLPVSAATSVPSGNKINCAAIKSELASRPPLSWNSTWTRIVDRQSDVVVYISPGGSRLKSVAEVRSHLKRWLPAERVEAISDECINSSFCFDASREVRLVLAPDDSVFVFPEDAEACNEASNSTFAPLVLAPLPLPPSDTLDDKSDSGPASPIAIARENPTTTSVDPAATVAIKRSAPSPEGTDMEDGTNCTTPHSSAPKITTAIAELESMPFKKTKIETKSTSLNHLAHIPSLGTDAAQTTSGFVARGITRAGGPTTVVPSVVPSVLSPSTAASSMHGAYALAQHMASLQQHQMLLTNAGLIHPVDAAHQQQQSVAATAAAALLLQQQQLQMQLQQHLQAVYAAALHQQQQNHKDGNQ